MDATPQAAKVLQAALAAHGWQQADLAEKTGIVRPTVSHHLNGSRVIRDDHLAAYCKALSREEQAMLVSAWLRDTLTQEAQENVLDTHASRLNESTRSWQPGLTEEQQSMLDFWSKVLVSDPEVASIFAAVTRKAGWTPTVKYGQSGKVTMTWGIKSGDGGAARGKSA